MSVLKPPLSFAGQRKANSGGSTASVESPEMRALREALGALPLGEPAICRVFEAGGEWHVHRQSGAAHSVFPTKGEALAFARLCLVRSASYCLILQQEDGRATREAFNWQPRCVR